MSSSETGSPFGIMLSQREECPMANAAVRDDQPARRFAKDQLKSFVERVERLEEEKKAISDDIRDVYGEAKVDGFDIKALRTVVRLRKQDVNERKEQEAILETYLHALGMLE
jgi:uncharacterized protein (UPF0335 family)